MNENVKDTNIELKDEERTKCEIWTRVMGYHRPISSFNIGKQGEFAERKYFDEKKCGCSKSSLIKENPLVASRFERFFVLIFSL